MGITVSPAETKREVAKVCELRYRIYVEELHIPTPEADHEWRWLRDPLEEHSISFAAWQDDRAIGSLRLTLLSDLPDPQPLLTRLSMHPALGSFGSEAICTTSRFMLDPKLRNGRVIYPLMKAVFEYARDRGVRLNYGDCSPDQLPFYEHLGFRSYERGFDDPAYGYKLPLIMMMGDNAEFAKRRTPLARVAAGYPDDTEVQRWFSEIYPGEPPALTRRDLGKGGVRNRLREHFGVEVDEGCELLRGLATNELDLVLDESTLFRVRAGDRITRRGEPATATFVLVNGEATARDASGRQVVGPGDHFGLTTSFHADHHTETVIAEAPCLAVAIPVAIFGVLRRKNPRIAAKLDANLAKLPSARLQRANCRVAVGGG